MQIVIHCGGMPFNGNTIPSGQSLGGSESAAYFMAKELAALGHRVICFTASQEMGKFDGVNYQFMGQQNQQNPMGVNFHTIMQIPHDVCIIQRHPLAFIRPMNTKLNIWWLHDLALIRNGPQVYHQMPFVDHVLCVSEFHRQQVAKIYDIDLNMITATTNGVDYSMFDGIVVRSLDDRQPKSLVFAARPERGLEEIIRPKTGLAELMPDYQFNICTYKNVPDHMRGFYEYCWQRCAELPNVKNHGFLGKKQLYDLLSRSTAYIYPTSFEDTSNIMLLEANAVGTPFVGLADHAALPETGKNGGFYQVKVNDQYQYGIDGKTNLSDDDLKIFTDKVKYICENESKWRQLHDKALQKRQSWKQAAMQWDKLFKSLLASKCSDKRRLFKHFEHYSDIYHIKDEAQEQLKDNYHFIYSGKYKEHYDKYYQYEEDRGVKYGPEDLDGNPRFEHTARIVDDLIKVFADKQLSFKNVLDYGCAHGHYVMNLVKRFPQLNYTGIDINQKNIEIANKWKAEQCPEVDMFYPNFICGTVENIETDQKFDLIICTEVLEHVPDPVALCEQLKKHLSKNGYMIITVPYGAWEAIGYEQHKGWRAHIHQLERQDLEDIFGKQLAFNLQGLPHSPNLGHYFVTFENNAEPLGKIDEHRKLQVQSPQETVSTCLIVKDGETTLARTLDSIKPIYDELIIGIDKTTTDDTRRICDKYGARYFNIDSPLQIGFDSARNKTIEKATCDWILWIDADEVMEQTENLRKYLRPNGFSGYGIKQHHFAVEPEGILKTDFPCRLFRNRIGFKFFGHVHEHPEIKECGKGIPNTGKIYVIPDVAIMHTGYTTEILRRKRFERNFPLMRIEREKYPDRHLGKFLWMRDLAHLCKYTLERNGGQMTAEVKQWAMEGVQIFRDMVSCETPSVRLIADGIMYQSEMARYLANGNTIEFAFDFGSAKGRPLQQKMPVHGHFLTQGDIDNLVNVMVTENTKYYEDKYY